MENKNSSVVIVGSGISGLYCALKLAETCPNVYDISLITKSIFLECGLSMDDAFIDGSKFEADANKYKFVWKPTKFHLKLSAKIRDLLMKYSLHNAIPSSGIIESTLISKKITELNTLIRSLNVNTNDYKNYLKDYHLLCEYLNKSLEYEEKWEKKYLK